jgi:hypothetical protein
VTNVGKNIVNKRRFVTFSLKLSFCFILTISCLIFLSGVVDSKEIDGDYSKNEIVFGVYIYDYSIKKYAQESSKLFLDALSEHLEILKKNNVNAVYMSISDPREFEMILDVFEDKNIKIIPQLNFAYFKNEWSKIDVNIKAKIASEYIKKYKNKKIIIGWSLKEEVKKEEVSNLSEYYKKIINFEPEAKFVLVHNNLGAATDFPEPYPYIEGVNRYGFWWEFSGGGYLASPSFALKWTRDNFSIFYDEVSERSKNFMTVFTQGGLTMPNAANKKLKYEDLLVSIDDKILTNKIKKFADEGRMGWKKFNTSKGAKYNFWKYYRLPENCMKVLMWSSVMEGAKYIFCWSYRPLSPIEESISFETAASLDKNEISIWTLAGRQGHSNPELKEFSETILDIKKYEKIILYSSKLPNSKLICNNDNFYNREFKHMNVKGSIFIVHNSNVGTLNDNINFFDENANVFIDDEGKLVDYKPYKDKMICNLKIVSDNKYKLFNLESLKELNLVNSTTQVEIAPGSGVLLFYGPEDSFKYLKSVLLN